jgi:hypothetical protein
LVDCFEAFAGKSAAHRRDTDRVLGGGLAGVETTLESVEEHLAFDSWGLWAAGLAGCFEPPVARCCGAAELDGEVGAAAPRPVGGHERAIVEFRVRGAGSAGGDAGVAEPSPHCLGRDSVLGGDLAEAESIAGLVVDGGSLHTAGGIHGNADVVVGEEGDVVGRVTSVAAAGIDPGVVLNPAEGNPAQVEERSFAPIDIADYRPGGSVAELAAVQGRFYIVVRRDEVAGGNVNPDWPHRARAHPRGRRICAGHRFRT